MTSNFWLRPSDLNDDFEDDCYSSDSEVEESQRQPVSRFDIDFDEHEQEEKRVFRSFEERKWDQLQNSIKIIHNAMTNLDWNGIYSEWENLQRIIQKSHSVFSKSGVPQFLINFLVSLDDLVKEVGLRRSEEPSSTSSRSFNLMKQKFKKWLGSNSVFAQKLIDFRENPSIFQEDEGKDVVAPSVPSNSEFSNYTGDLSSASKPKLQGRVKWLKRTEGGESSSESDSDEMWLDESDSDETRPLKKTISKSQRKARVSKSSSLSSDSENETSTYDTKPIVEWTPEKIEAKYMELVARRGTKKYDRLSQISMFKLLLERTIEKAYTPGRVLRLLFSLVDAQFDANPNMSSNLYVCLWKSCFNSIYRILEILKQSGDGSELFSGEPYTRDDIPQIHSLLLSQLERLDDEFVKSLQVMDPHTKDYVARLRHENAFLKLAHLIFCYFESCNEHENMALVASRRLDHLHYRKDIESASQRTALREAQRIMLQDRHQVVMENDVHKNEDESGEAAIVPRGEDLIASEANESASLTAHYMEAIPDVELNIPDIPEDSDLSELVPSLCRIIFTYGDDRLKLRATLQYIYHLALYDRYYEAEMIISSRMQDDILSMDIPTQILYNRALVQVGLAAFRKGLISEAHSALMEIASSNRVKELLAQGIVSRQGEKTIEQEKLERRRQMPYPMHINTDMLEFVHLTSAMLLEVPNMASNIHDPRKRVISKAFRKAMDRQVFNGPPENIRDHVIAASKALIQGDVQKCTDLLMNLDVWKIIPKADQVKDIITQSIQNEALRTYLFTNAQFCLSIKMDHLVNLFSMPRHIVHSIISKMMHHDELHASWDQPSDSIIMNGQYPTRLQFLSLQFAERITSLVESVESQDTRQGYKERWGDGERQNQRRDNNDRHSRFGGNHNLGNMHMNVGSRDGIRSFFWNKMDKRGGGNDNYGNMGGNRRIGNSNYSVGGSQRTNYQGGNQRNR